MKPIYTQAGQEIVDMIQMAKDVEEYMAKAKADQVKADLERSAKLKALSAKLDRYL